MSDFTYVCDGNSCCLIPNYKLPPPTKKKCSNYTTCYNEILNDEDEFCKDCTDLPFENKKISFIEKNEECPICTKYMNKLVKRYDCEHFMCKNCFKKIFFDTSLSTPIFPYLVKDENKFMTDNDDDENIIKYKNQLDYCINFKNINHIENKKCQQCF